MCNQDKKPVVILMAEDDEDDYLLTKDAFRESHLLNDLRRVVDGEELMDYLLRRRQYENPEDSPRPTLILLDLNMPRKDGRKALQEIKSDPNLCDIPVIVLTTSQTHEDILRSYQLGVNSFIRKPATFEQLVTIMKDFKRYWFEIVELPPQGSHEKMPSLPLATQEEEKKQTAVATG